MFNYTFIKNYILLRLNLLMLSSLPPFLLSLILFIFWINFDSLILCDDENLRTMKDSLNLEMVYYNKANKELQFSLDMLDFERDGPGANKHNGAQHFFNKVSSAKVIEMQDTLSNIRKLEANIQKLDPNFKTSIEKIWFEDIAKRN